MRRLYSLPPWRCCLATLCTSFQPPPGPSPGFSLGYQTEIHLVMAAIRLQICIWTKRRATWSIVALSPWQCCLPTLSASLQLSPSHWPGLPYDDFISSGLRALYRITLGGLPISPAKRGTGSCKCVRSCHYNCRKLSLIPSQDMTYLDMQICSVRFIINPTVTWVGTLLNIIEEFFLHPRAPQLLSGVVFWATFRLLLF